MKNQPITRDERYYAVENASYKIGFNILAFGLLLWVTLKAAIYKESHWDLFALVVIASFAATIYQVRHKILSFSWKWVYLLIASGVLAAAVTFLLAWLD